ncbi:unnamed protein product [Clonostachys chloroleuca]|uniref:BAG domain-containing protein n=1 Tax=Clonostachys chloroleuca TaxID=1926264 RepID=A0AA35LY98_9HYPO|nr:unnamed protein product [Clonostachys chloroleuca]
MFVVAGQKGVLPWVTFTQTDKVDSRLPIAATSGAFQNLTSYLNETLLNFTTAFHGSGEYISESLGVPPSVIYGSVAALVALPLTMSRYWPSRGFSPYDTLPADAPDVTDEDFSYITSQDLDDPSLSVPVDAWHHPRTYRREREPEDDVLLIKNRSVTYPAHFPAYSIGDGKLLVMDVKERVALLMDLPDRVARKVKLLYKGKHLKDPSAPVREYGVKNKSELMAVVPEGEDGSSPSEGEIVNVVDSRNSSKPRRKKKGSKKKKDRSSGGEGDTTTSPRDSNSNFDPPNSPPAPSAPIGAGQPVVSPLPPRSGAATGPLKQLDDLTDEFESKWLPLCNEYIQSPPSDPKKRQEEHLKISESVLLHIILKTDGVDPDGAPDVRPRRKGLVSFAQDVLKIMDKVKEAGPKQ